MQVTRTNRDSERITFGERVCGNLIIDREAGEPVISKPEENHFMNLFEEFKSNFEAMEDAEIARTDAIEARDQAMLDLALITQAYTAATKAKARLLGWSTPVLRQFRIPVESERQRSLTDRSWIARALNLQKGHEAAMVAGVEPVLDPKPEDLAVRIEAAKARLKDYDLAQLAYLNLGNQFKGLRKTFDRCCNKMRYLISAYHVEQGLTLAELRNQLRRYGYAYKPTPPPEEESKPGSETPEGEQQPENPEQEEQKENQEQEKQEDTAQKTKKEDADNADADTSETEKAEAPKSKSKPKRKTAKVVKPKSSALPEAVEMDPFAELEQDLEHPEEDDFERILNVDDILAQFPNPNEGEGGEEQIETDA